MKTTSQTEKMEENHRSTMPIPDMQSLELALRQCIAADQVHAAYAAFVANERQAMQGRICAFIEREQLQLDEIMRKAGAMRDSTLSRFVQPVVINPIGVDITASQNQQKPYQANDSLSSFSLDDINMTAAISSGRGSSSTSGGSSSSQEESALTTTTTAGAGVAPLPPPPVAAVAAVTVAATRPSMIASEPIEASSGVVGGGGGTTFMRSSVLDDDDQLFSLDEDAPIDSMYTARYRNDVDDEEEGEEEGDTDDSGNGGDPDYPSHRRRESTNNAGKRYGGVVNQGISQGHTTGDRSSAYAAGRHVVTAAAPTSGGNGGGVTGAGALAYGTSLPVTIPGRFWPPREATDSVPDNADDLSSDDEALAHKTVLPTNRHKDLYREMRAQARSIQAADDPERLFGERPQRRRYRTGEGHHHHHQPGGTTRQRASAGGNGPNNGHIGDPTGVAGNGPHIIRARPAPTMVTAGGVPRLL